MKQLDLFATGQKEAAIAEWTSIIEEKIDFFNDDISMVKMFNEDLADGLGVIGLAFDQELTFEEVEYGVRHMDTAPRENLLEVLETHMSVE